MQLPSIKHRHFTTSFVVLVALLFIIASFSIGLFLGRQQAARANVPEGEGQVLSQGDVPAFLASDVDFREFWNV